MATREEKIAFIESKMASQGQGASASAPKSREEKIAFITQKMGGSPAPEKESSFLEDVVAVGKTIDSYTGAPARAAIGAVQNSENPLKAFGKQFGEDPDQAPTGKQIAQKAGIPNTSLSDVIPGAFTSDDKEANDWLKFKKGGAADISASGAAGLGVDLVADPMNFIPVGTVAKGVSKGVSAAAKGAIKATEAGIETAGKIASKIPGAKTAAVVSDVVKDSVGNSANALKTMFSPKQAEDYPKLLEIAKKNGIDPKLLPESVEFGEGSFISRASRNRAEGVIGQPHLERFQAGLEAVQDAAEKKISTIAGGSIPSSVEAGELIRKGYDDAVEELFNGVDVTYKSVTDMSPGIRLTEDSADKIASKLSGMEKFAKGQVVRGITGTEKGQAKQILQAVKAVKASNGSLKQLSEAMNTIGKHAFKKGQNSLAEIPIDQKKFQEMYFTLRDEFINSTAAQLGDDVAQSLIDSNALITNFNKDKEFVSHIIGNRNMSPEKIFASLVEHGDTQKINALKNLLPPATFQRLKGSFLASQIRRNADDAFTFKSFHNNLRNKKNVLGTLLSPEEINDLSEIIKLGDRFGNPVLSSSGTGASNVFRDIGQGIRSGVESDTVIGLLKDSARNKATKANQIIEKAKTVTEIPKAQPKQISAPFIKSENKNFQRLAAISPAVARTLSIQSGSKENDKGYQPKGETMWAVNGFTKLSDSDPKFKNPKLVEKLFSSKKGKQLLIELSDMKPGSKGFTSTVAQIKKLGGE